MQLQISANDTLWVDAKKIAFASLSALVFAMVLTAIFQSPPIPVQVAFAFFYFLAYKRTPIYLLFIFLTLTTYSAMWGGNIFGFNFNQKVFSKSLPNLGNFVGYFSILACFLHGYFKGFQFRKLDGILLIYFLYLVINTFVARDVGASIDFILRCPQFIALYLLVRQLLRDEEDFKRFITFTIIMSAVMFAALFWQLATLPSVFVTRHLISDVYIADTFIPIFLALAQIKQAQGKGGDSSKMMFMAIVSAFLAYFSGSRRVIILIGGYFLAYMVRTKQKGLTIVVFLIGIGAILKLGLLPSFMGERLEESMTVASATKERGEIDDASQSEFMSARDVLWEAGWRMFEDYPVMGIGVMNSEVFMEEYGATGFKNVRLHNIYLTHLADLGVIGFLLFLIVIITAFLSINRSIKLNKYAQNHYLLFNSHAQRDILFLALVTAFFGGNITYAKTGWYMFGIIVAMENISVKAFADTIVTGIKGNKEFQANATQPSMEVLN